MQIQPGDFRLIFEIVIVCGTIANGIYTWFSSKRTATQSAIDRLDERIKNAEDRILTNEQNIKHLPTDDDIKQLNESIQQLHGDLKEMSGRLSGINRAVDLINQHLLGNN